MIQPPSHPFVPSQLRAAADRDGAGASSGSPAVWLRGGPRRPQIAILGAPNRAKVLSALQQLRPLITEQADILVEDLEFTSDLSQLPIDLLLVLGGDGSILQSARQLAGRELPVLGINCGSLGFLAALSVEAFVKAWPEVCAGKFSIVDHLMLQVRQIRRGEVVAEQLALNEAAILGGPPYNLLEIDLYADGDLATTYRCDGLIVSTPVGSTAYNLSAGGPILRKHLRAIVIQPISPHTLTYRPLVDSAETELEMVVAHPGPATSIVTDGRVLGQLQRGDKVQIRAAEHAFQMVAVPGQNEYRTLRDKLGWGGSVLP